MAYVDFTMCETFRVQEQGRDPYEVTTNIQDTLWYEARPKSKGRQEDSATLKMLHLVWHAARRKGHTQEASVAGWLPSLERVQMLQDDEEEPDTEEDEDGGDELDEFGPFLETDPTQ